MKTIPKELLQTVADGQFYSGERLGELLGVSRVAVWKQLQKLSELGLQFESVKGRGYRLLQPIEWLSAEGIKAHLQSEFVPDLQVYDVLDSSNAELLRQLNQSLKPAKGSCVMAERQEAGRGRRGRQWISPYARNIYFSMSWDFDQGVASLSGLSLVVGLAVLKALNRLYPLPFQLKWPNDILLHNKKLAGILLEVVGDSTGLCHVVMGIGINVNWRDKVQAAEISQAWLCLAEVLGHDVNRNELIAAMIDELLIALPAFEQAGFAPFQQAWQAYDAFLHEDVAVQMGERFVFGRSQGVNSEGELLLETDVGVQTFNGGEVSLRRMS